MNEKWAAGMSPWHPTQTSAWRKRELLEGRAHLRQVGFIALTSLLYVLS